MAPWIAAHDQTEVKHREACYVEVEVEVAAVEDTECEAPVFDPS